MYLPAWPGLGMQELWVNARAQTAPFPLREPHVTYFHTARSAIYYLFAHLVASGRRMVLMPDYHMGNEVRAIRHAGAEIVWYPVTRDFEVDLEALRRLCRQHDAHVLFVIHYAGWPQPMDALRALCEDHGLLLVEDCALALLTEINGRPVGTFGDYAVFCLYKTLPLPDGGLLVQNRRVSKSLTELPLRSSGRMFVAGRVAELTLERFRSRHAHLGRLLMGMKRWVGRRLHALRVERVPVGDTGFNPAHVDIGMAAWSRRTLPRLDYEGIRSRRRHNFLVLKEQLAGHAAVRADLPPGACPLFFPLLVRDKAQASRALEERGVMATELWNEGDESVRGHEGAEARFLRRHVLELPIHQDITDAQIRYMARQVMDLDMILPPASPAEPIQAGRDRKPLAAAIHASGSAGEQGRISNQQGSSGVRS
jgi:perosamine synthetase